METKENIERKVEDTVKKSVKKGVKIFFFILLGIAIAFLVGYIVMRLWNWLMPHLFGLPQVSYWEAVGVLILAKIIFGFGGGGSHNNKKKSKKKEFFTNRCKGMRRDFSDWDHYDEFWKEEGEQAYKNYVKRINNGNHEGG
ncbi:hypothetical protein [Maribacter cobaltidurans]|uniref:Uncharacterized protein n=1 Tax=Maribacter cobaltidurans TaxID=1178778 RepID=A0A223V3L3_9FLAO|nr:hypothetical protein [Maribacter cobaltidurans]ASV29994.1 hypothetical protein CJ263_07030 [Maribacter cobaltidurans]GGD88073.1 hypothetical protein GCM10011412_27380 [Maribacter cobaltidurans]